jgi:hypothetical protein
VAAGMKGRRTQPSYLKAKVPHARNAEALASCIISTSPPGKDLGAVAAEEIFGGGLLAIAYPKIFMAGMGNEKPISKSGGGS